ncbi:MAG: hypothetical protein ACPG82_02030, partial [Porticoccaceae bacterium]
INSAQVAYISNTTFSEGMKTVTISYASDNASLTGLGLRVHFDSSELEYVSADNLLAKDLLVQPNNELELENSDSDSETDRNIVIGWAALLGGWPGDTNTDLVTLTFKVINQ